MAAAWKERLVPAAFRGVPFRVETSELTAGRKTVTHEYPRRDVAFVEDLGRRVRIFSIEAYVVGDDYLEQRDALHAALEEPGPGSLVHPYHGTRLVAVTGEIRIRESRLEGGYAQISVEFTETEAQPFSPSVTRSPLASVTRSSAVARGASERELLSSYRLRMPLTGTPGSLATKPLPGFTFSSLSSALSSVSSRLHAALAPIVNGTQSLGSLKRQVNGLVDNASSLVRDPFALAARMTQLFADLPGWPSTPRVGARALLTAYHGTDPASTGAATLAADAPPPAQVTATREIEVENYDVLVCYARRSIAIAAAEQAAAAAQVRVPTTTLSRDATDVGAVTGSAAALGGFDTYDEAVAMRDEVLAALDEQAELATDEVFAALIQLRADVIAAMPGDRHALPRLTPYTPAGTVPSLVLAYQVYGALALADDLVARNRVRHPGFVPGGRELQVLSRA